jgi:predicted AlkP superfamily pyrophosphatase or phosphodiesterase
MGALLARQGKYGVSSCPLRLFVAAAALFGASVVSAQSPPPKLVLFLSLDQGRAEYLERFRPALEGGLLLLMERGVVFTETHHAHAVTITAPGHASLSTGRFPSRSGIVGNHWYDRDEKREVYCVEDGDSHVLPVGNGEPKQPQFLGRSPRRLRGTTLGDWMKESFRTSRVYSAAGKDRSAVLMGGKKADGAFWFDGETGQWVTSRYYMDEYPVWVKEFHERRLADVYFGRTWEPLPVPESLLSTMNIEASGPGAKDSGVPKVLGRGSLAEDPGFYHALFETPFLEPYLLAFAESLVREEELGADEVTDFLALGFSSIDSVGHDYGPNSRELLDAVLRLDRELGAFFRFLDRTIGLGRVAVALSADHGVAPLPEFQARHGLPGGRISSSDLACIGRAGEPGWFLAPLQFDDKALAKKNVKREAAEARVAEQIAGCPGVARVWTRTAIENRESVVDPVLIQFARSYYAGRSPDLFVQFEEGLIDDARGTTHGSPYEYDTHVPGIISWPGIAPNRIGEPIATVDLPVTIAALLGLETPEDVDGVDRSGLMR